MQLIIKDGKVLATHEDHQDVADKYPGCECILWDKPLPQPEMDGDIPGIPDDPRSAEEKKLAYMDARRTAYPTVVEQLDMIYHDSLAGTETWLDAITAVKIAHPKTSVPFVNDETSITLEK